MFYTDLRLKWERAVVRSFLLLSIENEASLLPGQRILSRSQSEVN